MTRAGIARIVSASILFNLSFVAVAETKTSKKSQTRSQASKPSLKSQNNRQPQLSKKMPKGVVAQFALAMKLYDAGKFADALVAFDRIHRSYPAHEPTIIQYAKTLYKLDRIPDSYNLFARINPQYLDPETSYEYGYAFYVQNRFENALFAFKRVPVDHPLYDLANYYGAMCAIRLKKYADAEEMLDKAVVLPDKLARSKNLYQKHVTSLRQLQEKSDLERAAAEEKQRMANDPSKTQGKQPAGQPAAPTPAAPPAPEKYSHAGFFSVDRLVSISYLQTNQSSDLHGYSRKDYQSQIGIFEFMHGPVVPIGSKWDGDRRAAIGLQLYLAASSVTTEGVKDRLVAYEDSRDIIHNLTERMPKTTSTSGDVNGAVWIETPLPSDWWLGVDGHLGFSYPNFQRGQRYGTRGATGRLGWMKNAPTTWIVEILGTYDLIVDSETEPVTAQMISDNSVTVALPSSTSFRLGAKYVAYDYKLPVLPGPDSSVSGSLLAKQKFPLGFDISLSGTIEQQTNYIARGLSSVGSASADGQTLIGIAKIGAMPLPWLAVSAKHTRSKATWTVHQPERVEAFKAATSDYSEKTDLVGSLLFLF